MGGSNGGTTTRTRPLTKEAEVRGKPLETSRIEQPSPTPTVTPLNPRTIEWDVWFEHYIEYPTDSKGRRVIPRLYETEDGLKLGSWQNNQRQLYKSGKLLPIRMALLEKAGMVWNVHADQWEEGLRHFRAYPQDERRKREVPTNYIDADGFKLGAWQNNQRQLYRRKKLDDDQIWQLETSGMLWEPTDAAWELAFTAFKQYEKSKDGMRLVPEDYMTPEGFKLGGWQHTQRQSYRRGAMSRKRIKLLNKAGMVWDVQLVTWEQGMAEFLKYPPDEKGRRVVPTQWETRGGFRLGSWQHTQRQYYKRGKLAAERIERLEAAGIVWDMQSGDGSTWMDAYDLMEEYPPDAYGKRMIPIGHFTEDGFALGQWQSAQRQAYQRGQLNAEKKQMLDEIGMVWRLHDWAWDVGYNHFVAQPADSKGRRKIATNFVTPDGYALGVWQSKQRKAYSLGTLSEERESRLRAAGIIWDGQRQAWEEGFAHFVSWPANSHGKRLVPRNHVEPNGFNLGLWQHAQRQAHKLGELSIERTTRLEAAGIVWRVEKATSCAQQKGAPFRSAGRRQLSFTASAEEAEHLPPPDEEAWHDEWRQRIGCWWLALPGPTQAELGSCLGALSLHLGSRLESLLQRHTPRAASAEPSCKWIEDAPEMLQLPDFPDLGSFEFTVPPIPRLLPEWNQLQIHGSGTPQPHLVARQTHAVPMAIGVGAGGLTFVAAAVLGSWMRKRGGRCALRQQALRGSASSSE